MKDSKFGIRNICHLANEFNDTHEGNTRSENNNKEETRKLQAQQASRSSYFGFRYRCRRLRKFLLVVLYAWLFMNFDPIYTRRTLTTMIASRLIQRSLSDVMNGGGGRGGLGGRRGGDGGMSTAEAIALISAINSGNNRALSHPIETSLVSNSRQTGLLRQQQQEVQDRQLPVPVPVPVPTPIPPVLAPIAAAVAALAALVAAALAGLNPFQAIFAVFLFFIALVFALIPTPMAPKNGKGAPLIKKLVIKKTVLPFVIPIPYKQKEKEKEIIYKYVKEKKHHHHDYEHDHHEYKSDEVSSRDDNGKRSSSSSWKKIENLMSEQDKLQSMIDSVVESKASSDTLTRRIR